jgi:hypothetical protein
MRFLRADSGFFISFGCGGANAPNRTVVSRPTLEAGGEKRDIFNALS